MPASRVPKIYDSTVADGELAINTGEAHGMRWRLAVEEGLLVGISAAAAMVGALQVARSAPPGSVVATVFPDSVGKYRSEQFWEAAA
ncbi:MAG: hypothetical protein P4M01_12535 [Acidobacteriota bacterium]|nr:hypothetical protein [Acidobacteriota bacterium]